MMMEEVLAQANREASEAALKEAGESSQWLPPNEGPYAFDFVPYQGELGEPDCVPVLYDLCKTKEGLKMPMVKFRIKFASGEEGVVGTETFYTVRWTNVRGLQELREKISEHLGTGLPNNDPEIFMGAARLVTDQTRWTGQVSKSDKGKFFNIRGKIAR